MLVPLSATKRCQTKLLGVVHKKNRTKNSTKKSHNNRRGRFQKYFRFIIVHTLQENPQQTFFTNMSTLTDINNHTTDNYKNDTKRTTSTKQTDCTLYKVANTSSKCLTKKKKPKKSKKSKKKIKTKKTTRAPPPYALFVKMKYNECTGTFAERQKQISGMWASTDKKVFQKSIGYDSSPVLPALRPWKERDEGSWALHFGFETHQLYPPPTNPEASFALKKKILDDIGQILVKNEDYTMQFGTVLQEAHGWTYYAKEVSEESLTVDLNRIKKKLEENGYDLIYGGESAGGWEDYFSYQPVPKNLPEEQRSLLPFW